MKRWICAAPVSAVFVVLVGLGLVLETGPVYGQDGPTSRPVADECTVDLAKSGRMKDILSNALTRGLGVAEGDTSKFLLFAESRYQTGADLLKDAAAHFKIDAAKLAAEVERYKHCNCTHEGAFDPGASRNDDQGALALREQSATVSQFAADVVLHVILHEMAHGLIREFDLPILGNEETMADAFATYYLTHYMPERAADVLTARVKSWMIEAAEVPRAEWPVNGEHNNDARRAYEVAALAVAVDPVKYAEVARAAGLSEKDVNRATDYGAEIHRGWRRALRPLWMPPGMASKEAEVVVNSESEFFGQLKTLGVFADVESALKKFDWHSNVKVKFVSGEGGAGWNRSSRTVTVHSEYVLRFIDQGVLAAAVKPDKKE